MILQPTVGLREAASHGLRLVAARVRGRARGTTTPPGGGGTTTPPGGGGTTTPPPGPFLFGPYKDVTVSMNWNTNVISSAVTGTLQPVLTVMPTNLKSLIWSFATGECGSENWAGIQPNALVSANVQNWVSMGKFYVISTGGAAGVFTLWVRCRFHNVHQPV